MRTRSRAFVQGVCWATMLAACEPNVPMRDPRSNCTVVPGPHWNANQLYLEHHSPHHCPLVIDYESGFYPVPKYYEAVFNAPFGRVAEGEILETLFYNHQHILRGSVTDVVVRASDRMRADVNGTYLAGEIEPPFGVMGEDGAVQSVRLASGQATSAAAVITYVAPYAVAIHGPPQTQWPNFPSMWTSVNRMAVSPVRYEWLVNDVSTGPPSEGASSYTDYNAAPNTGNWYRVIVTDASGAVVSSETLYVWVYPDDDGDPECDPEIMDYCPE